MEKITKVNIIYLQRLNNAEYRTFMARYGNLLAGGGGDSESPDEISFDPNDPLGIPQELRTAFATREQVPVAGHEGSVLGVVQFRDVNVFYFCNLFHFLVDLDP